MGRISSFKPIKILFMGILGGPSSWGTEHCLIQIIIINICRISVAYYLSLCQLKLVLLLYRFNDKLYLHFTSYTFQYFRVNDKMLNNFADSLWTMSIFHPMGNGWQVRLLINLWSYGMALQGNLSRPFVVTLGLFIRSGKT